MTNWYSISITVAPEAAEAIEYAFNSLDSLGTEIDHLQKKTSESVTVVGYFDDLPDDEPGSRKFAVLGKNAVVPANFVMAAGAEVGPDVIPSDLGPSPLLDGLSVFTKRRPHEV